MVMLELLRVQAQAQAQLLTNCVIALARDPVSPDQLNACAAAARSFESTAHMVGLEAGAELARSIEECLAAVRRGEIELQQQLIGMMLQAVDLLDSMARLSRETAPASPASMAVTKESAQSSKHKPVVLVADDCMEMRELERKLLRFRGYDVITAADGLEAWYAIASGNIDLVLTDIDMPLLDGIQLIRRIRKDPRFKNLPVLLACDKDDVQQRWRGFDAGATYYVIKGTFHDTLVEAVATRIGPTEF